MRFQVIYNIGEDLSKEEVKSKIQKGFLEDTQLILRDNTGELPDLIIEDYDDASKYVQYMNKPVNARKISELIDDINRKLSSMNNLNYRLIKPVEVIDFYDEDDNPVYNTPLKEELYFKGYNLRIKEDTNYILRKLNELSSLLTNK